jgi:hypothetical protein
MAFGLAQATAGVAAAGGAADWGGAVGGLTAGAAGACANVMGEAAGGWAGKLGDAWGAPRGACAALSDRGADADVAAGLSTCAALRGVAEPNQRLCTMP